MFFYLFARVFEAEQKKLFVSLDPNSGGCDEIARPWTITGLLADYYGNYEGQSDFKLNFAIYNFDINNFVATIDEYYHWVDAMDKAIQNIGMAGKLASYAYIYNVNAMSDFLKGKLHPNRTFL